MLGADDDHVIVTAAIRGRTKQGGDDRDRSVWIYKLRGGQVVSAESFADTAQVLEALESAAILTSLSVVVVTHEHRSTVERRCCARWPSSSRTATS